MLNGRCRNVTYEDVRDVIVIAHRKGTKAAAAKYEEMFSANPRHDRLLGLCGGSFIRIQLDGRTRLARQLKIASNQVDQFKFGSRGRNGNKIVRFNFGHGQQEAVVDEAGSKAALAVLEKGLRVVGYVCRYYC